MIATAGEIPGSERLLDQSFIVWNKTGKLRRAYPRELCQDGSF
jgi:hypothetical protein